MSNKNTYEWRGYHSKSIPLVGRVVDVNRFDRFEAIDSEVQTKGFQRMLSDRRIVKIDIEREKIKLSRDVVITTANVVSEGTTTARSKRKEVGGDK